MYKALSVGHLGFPNRSLREDVPLAAKFGFEGIFFDVKKEFSESSVSEVQDLLASHKLKNSGFGLPFDFRKSKEIFEEDFKQLRSYCDFAQKAGAKRCLACIMPFSDTLNFNENFALHKERLTPVAKLLDEYGIRFGFEFVGPPTFRRGKAHEFIHDLDGLNELIDAIGAPNLGYLLDVFHWDTAGQSYEDFRKIKGPEWVVMVHINDGQKGLSIEEQLDQERELPGATGVLHIDDFFKGLSALNYDGPVVVEPFYAPLKAMPVEEAVKAAKDAMDKVWPK